MRHHKPIAAVDARTLVPVTDDAGGVVMYVGGRAAYYVLNGEWFAALPEPGEGREDDVARSAMVAGRGTTPTAVELDRLVSTS